MKTTETYRCLQTVSLPTHDLLSGCRVYLPWHLHMGPFSVSSQVCWQPPLPWLQVTAGSTTRNRKTLNQCSICVRATRWACGVKSASCRWARTDAASLVPGQLEPWTTLAGHTPFGCLFADVGAAVLLIHTVEALWDRRRERGTQWNSPTVTDRLHTKAHTHWEISLASSKTLIVLTPYTIQKHQPGCYF